MKKIIALILLVVTIAIVAFLLVRSINKPEQTIITHDMVLLQVEELGQLELVKYNIRDVIEYKKMRQWLPNSKTALIVVGEVISCVDLSKIQKEDIVVIKDSVSLTLPIPEICHFKVDHTRSRVYDIQYGLWDTHQLVDEAYREAERQLYQQALSMGIANESRQSAIKLLTPLLKAFGFNKVSINFKESTNRYTPGQEIIKILPKK